jgi:hypothetical protein
LHIWIWGFGELLGYVIYNQNAVVSATYVWAEVVFGMEAEVQMTCYLPEIGTNHAHRRKTHSDDERGFGLTA